MKTFITIKDGKIGEIRQQNKSPGEGWQEVPNFFDGSHGDKVEWFNNWRKMSDDELADRGLIINDKGVWYNKETREEKPIREFNVGIDKTLFTKEKPIENEQFQKWDEQENEWIVDTVKKKLAKKEAELAEAKAEIAENEQKRLRSILAELDGEADEEDEKYNLKYKTRILELRVKIEELDTEIKNIA